MMLQSRLRKIIDQQNLTALFQPIIHMQSGEIIGYEGLIRGPSDSPLHSPLNLFKVALAANLSVEVEHLCRKVVIEHFAQMNLPGKLFLNVSPECLLYPNMKHGETLDYIQQFGISPERVIIELTESQPTYDYELLGKAVAHYSAMGFEIAIDDLGEGFSSLRLWSELRPAYVKIDMHFIQGINLDKVKLQFVRSIQQIAEATGTLVIAEGIETQAELLMVRDLGIACGQGYHIGRPCNEPATQVSREIAQTLGYHGVAVYPQEKISRQGDATALRLLRVVAPLSPQMSNNEVLDIFVHAPELEVIPVVENGFPLGLITRRNLVDRFALQFMRELHGKKPCDMFMDRAPLITDKHTKLQDLSRLVAKADRHHLFNGFIITDQGQYLGMGTGHDLMGEITEMHMNAARYANPLTQLPGNVPINEHIERLLENGARFSACYVDLDFFKPFNDAFGYRKGDDVIQRTGKILERHCDGARDFVGHIGGDDFLLLLQSEDCEERYRAIIAAFAADIALQFSGSDRERGGYLSENRLGQTVLNPLVTISLGALRVEPGQFCSHHQIATAAAEAKRQAKRITGNSLFIDRRAGPCATATPAVDERKRAATVACAHAAAPLTHHPLGQIWPSLQN
ncbi:GGDEF domain-containing protein [Massilia glaciei]|uniref:GGDEF domain-containing protein n=1 Tax=Massilia glaciei TaxID=1524097 RepID=A0A2U2HK16_9BURK|nr:GGDEF domain-containing protein [Massilia glaciei]PWF47829.1 GGDEF domain-containing protein [Massilia glaciei]